MNNYLVIGAPGMGKTPFVKKLIGSDKRCLIFDVQNEYGPRVKYAGLIPVNLSSNNNDMRSRYIGTDIRRFIELCKMKRNTICVFEEATQFFRGKTSLDVIQLMIGRYHTGNNYVFLFHSINSIPPGIMEMTSFVVLFKTYDVEKTVSSKFYRLSDAFKKLQAEKSGESIVIKTL